ncbi:PREDICTED: ras-related protein Rab-20 [Condylura cristata]|uniref:ras-related protein Rab-20 n=1 Tax=Condylura cristata TaxID=143302 RepID=UPI0006435D78|nr:PREDICTED: ras-related protein Rab-20 [Condylura cristata]
MTIPGMCELSHGPGGPGTGEEVRGRGSGSTLHTQRVRRQSLIPAVSQSHARQAAAPPGTRPRRQPGVGAGSQPVGKAAYGSASTRDLPTDVVATRRVASCPPARVGVLGLTAASVPAGREQFHGLGSMYCRGAVAVILTYDVNHLQSLRELEDRFLGLTDTASTDCLFAIVGNKVDLSEEAPAGGEGGRGPGPARQVRPEDALALYRRILRYRMLDEKDVPAAEQMCFETSAKTGHNVDRLFETLFDLVERVILQHQQQPPQTVELSAREPPARTKSGCCA